MWRREGWEVWREASCGTAAAVAGRGGRLVRDVAGLPLLASGAVTDATERRDASAERRELWLERCDRAAASSIGARPLPRGRAACMHRLCMYYAEPLHVFS